MIAPTNALQEVFDQLYRPVKLRGKSKGTVRLYLICLKGFSEYLGRPASLEDLNDIAVSSYLDSLATSKIFGRLRAPQTINQRRDKLCAFWRWCARKGLVKDWPDIESIPEPERIPQAYTLPNVERLYGVLRGQPGSVAGVPAGIWWESLYRAAYGTGERTTALLSSRCEHLDLDAGTLYIPAQVRKGRRKSMLYHLLPDAVSMLRQVAHIERDLIWPWPMSMETFYNHTKKIHQKSGVGRGGIQRMRRTFASLLKEAGGNPTEALGHSSTRVTEKSYLDPRVITKAPENRKLPKID